MCDHARDHRGMIHPDSPDSVKAARYVDMLFEGRKEEAMLMGESALWTRPYYDVLQHCGAYDLEVFSACCGLTQLSQKQQNFKYIEEALLRDQNGLEALIGWTYKTPLVAPPANNSEEDEDYEDPPREAPQYDMIYPKFMYDGPFGVLFHICTKSPRLCQKITTTKHFPGFIGRVLELAERPPNAIYREITKLAVGVLKGLLEQPKTIEQILLDSNLNDFLHSSNIPLEMKLKVKKDWKDSDMKPRPMCAICGKKNGLKKNAPLAKCASCESVLYCSRDCQKFDWPKHKLHCKKVNSQTV